MRRKAHKGYWLCRYAVNLDELTEAKRTQPPDEKTKASEVMAFAARSLGRLPVEVESSGEAVRIALSWLHEDYAAALERERMESEHETKDSQRLLALSVRREPRRNQRSS
ncbi:MAG: hypothetical protein O7E52_23975 [Candidatus Poribacteria bacterium]|nr:hypothetical protein [Candidatus Poribacteria bacterium]